MAEMSYNIVNLIIIKREKLKAVTCAPMYIKLIKFKCGYN